MHERALWPRGRARLAATKSCPRLDPPAIKGRAETSLAFDALEVQIRDPPAEAHGIPSRPRPMERTAELPMLHYLVDGKPPTIGPMDDERVDAPLVGDAGVDADVLLPGPVCRYVSFVVSHDVYYRTQVRYKQPSTEEWQNGYGHHRDTGYAIPNLDRIPKEGASSSAFAMKPRRSSGTSAISTKTRRSRTVTVTAPPHGRRRHRHALRIVLAHDCRNRMTGLSGTLTDAGAPLSTPMAIASHRACEGGLAVFREVRDPNEVPKLA